MLERLLFLTPALLRRPFLAAEISTAGVMAARLDGEDTKDGENLLTHFVPLASGTVQPGVKGPNLVQRGRLVTALRSALNEVADRDRNMTLVLPDGAVRVLLIDFDSLPSKAADVLPIIRFRLRKLVPFDVEGAPISYQVMPRLPAAGALPGAPVQTRVLVTVTPRDVLTEYESAVREAGYEPGVVLSSTLAAAALLSPEPALLVNRNGSTLTTAIVRGDEVLLHRSLEFEPEEEGADQATFVAHDVRQNVSVAVAYFEDTLAMQPSSVYYIGPGSSADFVTLLDDPTLEIRDLVPERGSASLERASGNSARSAGNPVPRSLLGPIAGALAST